MERLRRLAPALVGLAVLACGPRPPTGVVILTMDTTRADALGAYGQRKPTTPRIDRMAREGLLFEQVVTSVPSTLPAHASLFTGREPFAHGVRSNVGYRLAEQNQTLAEVLSARGWVTGAEIAATVLGRWGRLDQGFARYRDPVSLESVVSRLERGESGSRQSRRARDITNGGIEFLRENAGSSFLLWLHYFDPHHPHEAPELLVRELGPYHAEVRRVDRNVGRLLDEIEALGLRDRTVVVLTADHGEGLGQHGEPTHSFFVYDSTMRIPLIFWGSPVVPRGQRVSSLVRLVDVAPTLLDLLGMPPLEGVQGTSLVPLFEDPGRDLRLDGYGESIEPTLAFGSGVLRFLRVGRWKYIHKSEPELYDVVADPRELRNRADEHPERVAELRSRLEAFVTNAPPPPGDARLEVDDATRAELQALGYVTGPAAVLADEATLLEPRGPDPIAMLDDVQAITYAWGHIFAGRPDRAVEVLREVDARNPDRPVVLYGLAEALRRAGRESERIELLRRRIALGQDPLGSRVDLARALQDRDPREAEVLLREALALDPCEARPRVLLSVLLREQSREGEQIELLQSRDAGCRPAAAVDNALAFALATSPDPALRDGTRAVALAEAAVARTGASHPDYLDTLAAAHAERGDFRRAVEEQRRALALVAERDVPPEILEAFERHLGEFEAGRPLRRP